MSRDRVLEKPGAGRSGGSWWTAGFCRSRKGLMPGSFLDLPPILTRSSSIVSKTGFLTLRHGFIDLFPSSSSRIAATPGDLDGPLRFRKRSAVPGGTSALEKQVVTRYNINNYPASQRHPRWPDSQHRGLAPRELLQRNHLNLQEESSPAFYASSAKSSASASSLAPIVFGRVRSVSQQGA